MRYDSPKSEVSNNMRSNIPKVSIITVTYNAEKYLEETIESVLAQTYTEIEYIIIDGNSTDQTLDIIKKYAHKIDYWQSEPDQGIYDAMNKGLAKATGEYVWFMNAGDSIFAPDTLSQVFEMPPFASVYYGEAAYYDLEGNYLGLRSEVMPHQLPSQLTWQHFSKGMVVCHQSIIVRREIAPRYDLRHAYSADIDWVIKVLKLADSIRHTQLTLSKYKQGGFSKKFLRKSLWDRALILSKHFGKWHTLKNHVWIVCRAFFFFIKKKIK